jgi:tyrosyl-tRNA synthetase
MAADVLTTLASGSVDLVPRGGLEERLALGRPLRVKLGVDPSRPDLTLGHAVVLRKLRQFQDAGHVAVLIVGDFTARIGDPSGQSETRQMLTQDEIRANAATYLAQAGKVIDVDAAEIHGNAEWLSAMDMGELIELASTATVAQMLEREDFRDRHQHQRPISVVEFLYPLFQGYDSVAVRADVEIGGTDQKFNLLMGREVQRAHQQEPQVVLTVPLLEGTDGVRKMSKSLDNFIGLTEQPEEMFGKLMRIPDQLIAKYVRSSTPMEPDEVDAIERGLSDGTVHPNEAKRRLAREVVDLYHGAGAGAAAEDRFNVVHREHEIPDEIADAHVPASVFGEEEDGIWVVYVPALLEAMGLVRSRSEARRLQTQGGVRVNGEQETREDVRVIGEPPGQLMGSVWQVGRRKFARLAGISSGEGDRTTVRGMRPG